MAEEKSWQELHLPEDLRTAANVKDFKDIPTLVKSYVEAQSVIGRSLRLPGPDANEELQTKFREELRAKVPGLVDAKDEPALLKAVGVPSEPKEYEPPKEVQLAPERVEAVRQFAKEHNLTKKQAVKFFEQERDAQLAAEKFQADTREALRKEWGQATEERVALAVTAAERLGAPKALQEAAKQGKLGAEDVKWLYTLAKSTGSEGNDNAKNKDAIPGSITPDEAENQIAEIQKHEAFMKNNDPRHAPLMRKYQELIEIASAGRKSNSAYVGLQGRK